MNDLPTDINTYGCVLFDVVQNAHGEWQPQPGAGWASIDGEAAVRITGLSDLNLGVMWLSNLDQKVHWQATLFNVPQIKDSKYLRTSMEQVMREIGVSAKTVGPAHSAEAVAEVFGRIMRLAKEYCDRLGWGRATLMAELAQGLGLHDSPYDDPLLDEAFARSYQDRVDCTKPSTSTGERWITFRRPRLLHAQQVIGKSFMVPHGPWKFVGEKDMPKKDERLAWVNQTFGGAPYMVKVKKLNFYRPLETDRFNPADLLKLGESILPGRQRLQREWIPMPELLYMSKFADIEFDSVCVGAYYDEPGFALLPELDYMMHHSYAWGILAENIWMTYASRSINNKAQNKTLVSARATWLRAIDRFYCFTAASQVSVPGNTVLFYGTGSVTVACPEPKMGEMIQHGVNGGLQAPASSYMHWRKWHEKEAAAQKTRQNMPTHLNDLLLQPILTKTEQMKGEPAPTPKPSFANDTNDSQN